MSRDLYRDHAALYADLTVTSPPNAAYDRPTVLRLAGDLSGQRVLELGCAGGALTELLVGSGAESVLALDGEPQMVAIARERLGGRARVELADLERPLDLPDASADVVVASLVLHYLADWGPLLGELHRVLVPGGRLVFSIHHPITGWLLSDRSDYHRTELIHERWRWADLAVTAGMYRRPISAVFGSLRAAGFAVDVVDEPVPELDADAVDPDVARALLTEPVFLFVRALREER